MEKWTHLTNRDGLPRLSGTLLAMVAVLAGAAFSIAAAPGEAMAAVCANPQSRSAPAAVLHQAEVDFGNGRIEEALQECRTAIELNPQSAEAYYLLGVIQDRRGAVEESRKALRRSLELDPGRVDAHIYLGESLLHDKQFDQARAVFQSALQLGDDADAEAHFGLALVLISESKYREALPYLTAAV